jgi:hypothetical protein
MMNDENTIIVNGAGIEALGRGGERNLFLGAT